jgi:hypothetical protein
VADYLEFKSLNGLYCSLSRPQNKAKPSSTELDTLIRCIRDNTKLPPSLCSVITHALALAPFGQIQAKHPYSTKNGVDNLLRHVSSLGRFNDTAMIFAPVPSFLPFDCIYIIAQVDLRVT